MERRCGECTRLLLQRFLQSVVVILVLVDPCTTVNAKCLIVTLILCGNENVLHLLG